VTRYAIGDVQGCERELRALLKQLGFSADRDRLWFVGDLVNRGPRSLETLRLLHALRDNAAIVLGNHDLHLLALAYGAHRHRKSDTLDAVLAARDRDRLLEWLAGCPLAHAEGADLMVHAGLVPQWSLATTLQLSGEVGAALRHDPQELLTHMYGDEPEAWDPALSGYERLRFIINVLTRMRLCSADGRIDVALRGAPPAALRPWFEQPERASRTARVIFGHWSALGLVQRAGIVGLDTGCVWGGALTAYDLDAERAPLSVPCAEYQRISA
jgi:bis(5'-nucleosyl)-tetraphosphatase (symmetrical)